MWHSSPHHPEERSRVYPERSRRVRISRPPRAANTPAARSLASRHHRWQKGPPSIQSRAVERSLKARRPCFVPSIRVSGEEPRTRDNFSASRPDFWGENTDGRRFMRSSSGNTGRIPGRAIHLGSVLVEKRSSCIEKRCKTSISSTAHH